MFSIKFMRLALTAAAFIGIAAPTMARDQVTGVGSSTVYPFATILSENFARKNPSYKAPIIESTGTGAGFKMFCQGVGLNTPDLANASRAMKQSEIDDCNNNSVGEIYDINIGYDVITLITPKNVNVSLTTKDLYLALSAYVPDSNGKLIKNPYKKWNEINPELPDLNIRVIGPSSAHGTYDAFLELVMDKACSAMIEEGAINLGSMNKKEACENIRTDGAWTIGGDDYSLVTTRVASSQGDFAVLGYNFFVQNQQRVNAASINGFAPTPENLSSKSYPIFRPLFLYVKAEHLDVVPGLREFISEITSKEAIGPNGYLVKEGLLAVDESEYQAMIQKINK